MSTKLIRGPYERFCAVVLGLWLGWFPAALLTAWIFQ